MVEAIRPTDIALAKAKLFPDYVFEAFNELIAAKFDRGVARVLAKDVIDLIVAKANKGLSSDDIDEGSGLVRNQVRPLGYLNIEDVYRSKDWLVSFHGPDYTESWDSYFEFKAPR